jgi:hypothetical protein
VGGDEPVAAKFRRVGGDGGYVGAPGSDRRAPEARMTSEEHDAEIKRLKRKVAELRRTMRFFL